MENSILIQNGIVIDGTGSAPYKASVLVGNGRIDAVFKEGLPPDLNPQQLVDAKGKYVLPGIIDCHVHVMIDAYRFTEQLSTPFSLNFYKAIDHCNRLLRAGITTARDAGGADFGVKKALEMGLIKGPELQISISILSTTGGHVDAWLPSGTQSHLLLPPYPGHPSGICDGPMEVRKRVREVLRSGADCIKVCSTGGVMGPNDHPEFTQFTVAELNIMVEEARMRKGKKVMAHAQGLEGIKNAIRAGVHSIEHGIFLDDEAIDLMLENNVFLVPTLLAVHSVIEGDYPTQVVDRAKAVFDTHRESIAKAHKAGVKIAMGTDSGVMGHGKNMEELRLMCEVGMSPMESIVASTKTAAECLGIVDRTGTLEIGKQADMLVLDANPLEKISSLGRDGNMAHILQKGTLI
ncbi:MAG: amidohydrolase family protein [Flavobacteriaceae bacterium]